MSLKTERKKQKLSTLDLSAKTGISKRTIEAYESGARNIKKASYESLSKLSKVLRVSIEKLIEE